MAPSTETENPGDHMLEFALGLHAPGRFDKIMPIHKCLLQQDVANKVILLCTLTNIGILLFLPQCCRNCHAKFHVLLNVQELRQWSIASGQWMSAFTSTTES